MNRSPSEQSDLSYSGGRLVAVDRLIRHFIGDRVRCEIPLAEIYSAEVTERSSFRHPWLGLAFAVALIVPSAWLLITRYVNAPVGLVIRGPGLAVVCGLLFGAWGLYQLLSAERLISVRLQTRDGRVEMPLPGATREQADAFVADLRRTWPILNLSAGSEISRNS
jgi:hypothetical protein